MLFQGQSQKRSRPGLTKVNAVITSMNTDKVANRISYNVNGSAAPANRAGSKVNCFNQCGLVPPEARCRVRLSL